MSKSHLPVIQFEPDGYVLDGPKLMGRQSAGNGFLRAAINAGSEHLKLDPETYLEVMTPHQQSARIFAQIVKEQGPELNSRWVPSDRLDLLKQNGALFLPGPDLAGAARQRLRIDPGAWSITGTTHTLCSHTAMDALVDIVAAPVMPWDALICASTVAQHAVKTLFELQAQYLNWRFGVTQCVIPQLPIIPFGVHQSDFEFSSDDRTRARKRLGVAPEKVMVLFAGRLSFHAKAHPYPMFVGLQRAAEKAKQDIELLLCGQFPNDAVKQAFFEGLKRYAPRVHPQWVDGKNFAHYNEAWAASDLFVSLSDNLQETFGITPVEAMAAGLPVVVSDWDGYKDTVEEGVTGYRIPTWMPPPSLGTALAASFEAGTIKYDRYIGLACLEVSVDLNVLTDRLYDLITQPALRAQMGSAGKKHVAQKYNWSIVMQQHIVLWKELYRIRIDGVKQNQAKFAAAPKASPARQDPYLVFESFPTHVIRPETEVQLEDAHADTQWADIKSDALFSFAGDFLPQPDDVKQIIECLSMVETHKISIQTLAEKLSLTPDQMIRVLAPMAKLGFVSFINSTPFNLIFEL
jgi:glycosyltransferase involved in cell wall biosynthesis